MKKTAESPFFGCGILLLSVCGAFFATTFCIPFDFVMCQYQTNRAKWGSGSLVSCAAGLVRDANWPWTASDYLRFRTLSDILSP